MKRTTLLLLLLVVPLQAQANGGGPLLLVFNGMAFVLGSIVIVGIEAGVYRYIAKAELSFAIRDAFWVNLWSTLIIGFGVPLLISILTASLSFIYEPLAEYSFYLGTWLFDGIKYPKVSVTFVYIWLILSFLMTVAFETKLLEKRWEKRSFVSPVSARKINWVGNAVTYTLLIIIFTLTFGLAIWQLS